MNPNIAHDSPNLSRWFLQSAQFWPPNSPNVAQKNRSVQKNSWENTGVLSELLKPYTLQPQAFPPLKNNLVQKEMASPTEIVPATLGAWHEQLQCLALRGIGVYML